MLPYLKSLSTKEAVYLLFHDTKRNNDGNIFVFMIIPRLQVITEHRGTIPDKAEVVDFEISNDVAYIGYNSRKSQPGIIGFSLVTGEKRNLRISPLKKMLYCLIFQLILPGRISLQHIKSSIHQPATTYL